MTFTVLCFCLHSRFHFLCLVHIQLVKHLPSNHQDRDCTFDFLSAGANSAHLWRGLLYKDIVSQGCHNPWKSWKIYLASYKRNELTKLSVLILYHNTLLLLFERNGVLSFYSFFRFLTVSSIPTIHQRLYL